MEQHPIPQAITTYEFRLVGEMTLKQFAKLASGLGLAFLLYVSPLTLYLKWPLILIFASLGIALAFVPIQGRPLEIWLIALIKAIYSPTEYLYQKQPELPEFLEGPVAAKLAVVTPRQPMTIPSRAELKEYLGTLPVQEKMTTWEQAEKRFLSQVKTAFEKVSPPVSPKTPKPFRASQAPKVPPQTVTPTTAQKAPPLLTPEKPNIISGIIRNQQGKLVEGAIVEIKDSGGFPVRALKSNSLGQFQIASPLENGLYQIEIEKESLEFNIIKIKLEGKIISPLEIKAK